ncbi:MAG TPA: GNAT family N-acetyltransferase [Maribacter sp.]|uniref:GNAT family N-acetyltransferase n=1 Tax=unclassified Maribacter TaxID=2615042 RepID=UPI000EDEDBA2|nr:MULTISPECIES: GNAT family N-acetyltransferase [unclassified Maribacter]HAF78254.1 GNAT family N-acetyltransferase [Maribacter sp.]HAI42100.1 GNAT family N-acetyltransferase [Maribacter sp.]|tara:strand:+ start:335 stop:784 length:450 start_codon:yes stop_codon:yes gene_type:complete
MLYYKRCSSDNKNFKELVALLDADLALRDGDENAFYAQFNGIDALKNCVVFYLDKTLVACGAFKEFNEDSVEIKRMFVQPDFRGKGIASKALKVLEDWAKELNYSYAVLETGLRQPEAIALYKKNNYTVIDNYAPYEYMDNSVCFRKAL